MAPQTLTIRRPDDWYVHLRDGDMLKRVAAYTARQFARAIVMPNLAPPITTIGGAIAYRERIIAAAHKHGDEELDKAAGAFHVVRTGDGRIGGDAAGNMNSAAE